MATDINLSSCQWIEPDQIRNYSDNKAIIKWALQLMTIGNWIVPKSHSSVMISSQLH